MTMVTGMQFRDFRTQWLGWETFGFREQICPKIQQMDTLVWLFHQGKCRNHSRIFSVTSSSVAVIAKTCSHPMIMMNSPQKRNSVKNWQSAERWVFKTKDFSSWIFHSYKSPLCFSDNGNTVWGHRKNPGAIPSFPLTKQSNQCIRYSVKKPPMTGFTLENT